MPAEILGEIFLKHPGYLHEVEKPLEAEHHCVDSEDAKCRLFCWVVVSHVCRRWREVALSCQSLWAVLPVSAHPEWMTELLRRSKTSPLLINAASLDREMNRKIRAGREKSLEIALRELPRIRSLYISATQGLPGRIIRLLASPSPLLEAAYLSGVLADRETLSSRTPNPDPLLFPDTPSNEDAPLPRCLRLYNVYLGIPPTGPCNSALRMLAITLSPTSHFNFEWPSVSQLLGVFSMLPSLKELRYTRQGDQAASEEVEDVQRVTLHRVHTLALSASAYECTIILDSLELPSLSLLQVTARQSYFTDVQALAPVLRTKISRLDTTRRLGIFCDSDDSGPLWVYGYSRYSDDGPLSSTGREHLFTIKLQDCTHCSESVSVIFDDVISCEDVHYATIEGGGVVALEWRTMLQAMNNLKALTVKRDLEPSDLFLELCGSETATQNAAAREDLCPVVPKLGALHLYGVNFAADVCGEWGHVRPSLRDADQPKTMLEGLKWVLKRRAKAGLALDLWLDFCRGLYEDMAGDLVDAMGPDGGVRSLRVCGDEATAINQDSDYEATAMDRDSD
ncbi:hypothetical protein FOMPIDRAFT_1050621 [Fomitopsis schrenkii]|uniref:Uncharacterized protein n=1 Tax=Fomitopsis schrenkii TaxID=2126942 RepID=S8FM10_FOMSC|nr:hypothetical protein FOMPIDRAFT_1050621 [Fomitopsis schrenkii]